MFKLMNNENTLKFDDISPNVLSVCHRHHTASHELSPKKFAYTYRLMYIVSGKIDFFINGSELKCENGDVLLLTPGIEYQTIFIEKDLDIYHLFFDITHSRNTTKITNFPQNGYFMSKADDFENSSLVNVTDMPNFNSPCVIKGCQMCERKFKSILNEYNEKQIFSRLRINATMIELLIDICRIHRSDSTTRTKKENAKQILQYIEAHIFEKTTCTDIANAFSYHPNYINQIMRDCYNKTLQKCIEETKISVATNLLDTTNLSITQIAHKLCYCDSSHFSHSYSKAVGITPCERRKYFVKY